MRRRTEASPDGSSAGSICFCCIIFLHVASMSRPHRRRCGKILEYGLEAGGRFVGSQAKLGSPGRGIQGSLDRRLPRPGAARGTSKPLTASAMPTPTTPPSRWTCAAASTPPKARASPSPQRAGYGSPPARRPTWNAPPWNSTGNTWRFTSRPMIGAVKLAQLTAPMVRALEDRLRAKLSTAMVRKILGFARLTSSPTPRNAASSPRTSSAACAGGAARQGTPCRQAPEGQAQGRHRYPHARTKSAPSLPSWKGHGGRLLLTAIFTGLRASELRGLRWVDVDLKRSELHVHQRADRLRQDRPAEVGIRRAHHSAAATGGECVARMEAGLPQGRTWAGVSQQHSGES